MSTTQMKIENKPIDSIIPYERNPRKNDSAVEAVVNSIREYGFRQPRWESNPQHSAWKAELAVFESNKIKGFIKPLSQFTKSLG